MPHVMVEYTDNLSSHTDIQSLLHKLGQVLVGLGDTYPVGGIRVRAHKVTEYRIADGKADDAFVHTTLKIGKGRSEEAKQATCEKLFDVMKEHFASIYEEKYLALSLELVEFQHKTYKHNNIHSRFR
ncbi:5-carboxymethyl-2-hydroxymuconate isomerase [Halobacillus halophilus]|uniref:5-carboxymethyl-2-hydroxymuconate delta-isomerase n=1 Tax=Halobacillus halophilus (strain ATCC 35676 / DSM 2266 / JCM 20832 / KCTC 3685 / LMG 17431 / NBRC 102448 / NCIMB 2269) TaxID=866895 RepID=I0JKQ5_HALH3|nr:5-carboxymethyl-2-hydroxymuconate Delta-isomerase [Halobacillus halophilus]ASF38857.1 5-carboxymethyl-2-hydroxymuconate isomerase [Halobacillus halophilus]CCG44724.1 5-carboxymethyl-2-hydroxymuconate delta-isomerase [Halobacillus halophilus DSM 2266]